MIKINYKGFQIELDSVEEAMSFMKIATVPPPAKKTLLGEVPKKSRRKMFRRSGWTEQELSLVVRLLEAGGNRNTVSRDQTLRTNHNQNAIKQMVSMFTSEKAYYTASSPLVIQYVKEYRGNRVNINATPFSFQAM